MEDILNAIQRNSVKQILDQHIGSANRISHKEWYDISFLTLETLQESLLSSFGKYASNTLIIHENVSSSSVFTQDGIHIVSSFEFASLIQTYIAKHVQYIGEKVEKGARDGTTTAMLLFIGILHRIYTDIYDDIENPDKEFLYRLLHEYKRCTEEVLFDISKFLEKIKISLDNDDISKEDMIYNLSYITSKGNTQLCDAMKILFKDTPTELYDYFTYYRSEVETENPFEVYIPEYDYELPIILRSGRAYFNKKINTVFEDKADIIIIPNTLFDGDFDDIKKIEFQLESSINAVIIIWSTINDKLIQVWEKKYHDKDIINVQYVNYVPELRESGMELTGFLKGSYKTLQGNFLPNIDVKIDQNKLFMNDVFQYEDNGFINKFYYDENSPFKVYIQEIQNRIQKLKNVHTKTNTEFELKETIKIYRKLVSPKYPILRIGGRTLDHLSMIDVVEDTVGSLTIALEEGCIVDGLHQLSEYLFDLTYSNDIKRRVCDIIYQEVSRLYDIAGPSDDIEVVQNYMTFKETFDRLRELLPKLILTTEVIVPGTVSLKEDKNGG